MDGQIKTDAPLEYCQQHDGTGRGDQSRPTSSITPGIAATPLTRSLAASGAVFSKTQGITIPWVRRSRTRGVCTICMAMCGNGARIYRDRMVRQK